jgi:protocatechuate 3,4-dioxygenase beta subunit
VGKVQVWKWREGAEYSSEWNGREGDSITLQFRGGEDGERFRLLIEAEGFARPTPPVVTVAKTMAPLTVDLEPPVPVAARGRVVDQDGRPVAGARVRVGLWMGAQEYETPWGPEPTTDAEGRYELTHLRAGDRFRVEAAENGLTRAMSPRLTAERNTPLTVPDLRLSSARRTVAGTVADPSGGPVANARVYTTTPVAKETRTDAAGKFTLADLPADVTRVWVDAAGFIVREHGVAAGENDTQISLYRLDPDPAAYRLQVRLKPRGGGAVTKSQVWVLLKGPPPRLQYWTAPQGDRYESADERFFGRHAGQTLVLIVESEGFARPKPVEFTAGKDMPPVEVELEPAAPATVRGRVVDPDGKPVTGAGIGLSKQLYGDARDEPWRYVNSRERLLQTGADGRFEIPGVAVGTRFAVKTGKTGTAGAMSEWRTVEKSGDVALPDLVLRPATGVLTGTVVDDRGRPVAAARVEYYDRFGRAATVSDERGGFRLEGLPDGDVYLTAQADDFQPWRDVVKSGRTNLKVMLRRAE